MKSRIIICLLLMVTMLAFVGCGDNSTTGTLEDDASRMVDDVKRDVDRMTDDVMDGTDRNFGDGMNDNVNRTTAGAADGSY